MSDMNNEVMTTKTPKKNVGYRLFAVLLIAVCALAALVLPFNAIYTTAADGVQQNTLLTIFTDMLDGSDKVFGVIPSFAVSGAVGTVYTLAIYLFLAGVAIAAMLALVAIFTAKKSPALVRASIFFMTAGAMVYAISLTLALKTYFAEVKPMYCIIALALAVAGMVLYFLFATKKAGKVSVLYFIQAILSVVFAGFLALSIGKSNALAAEELNIFATVGVVVMLINTLISIGRMTKAGGIVFDLVRYFIVLFVSLLVIAKTSATLFGVLAAVVVVLQIILSIIQLIASKKKEVEVAREEATQQATTGFHMEEYAEAYPYEGGPVAGVLMAEEVNPSFIPQPPHVNTAGYDFYNSKSFDPFIATLDMAERNEFTELFILKFKGTMPELPDYEVGGDNREFFRKIFIYLGQYRDRMSQSLLAKMYQFSMKI